MKDEIGQMITRRDKAKELEFENKRQGYKWPVKTDCKWMIPVGHIDTGGLGVKSEALGRKKIPKGLISRAE